MRFPLSTPAEDDRRHPRSTRARFAALAVAVTVVGAVAAAPLAAYAEDAQFGDVPVETTDGPAEALPGDAADAPAEVPLDAADAPLEAAPDAADAPPEPGAPVEYLDPADASAPGGEGEPVESAAPGATEAPAPGGTAEEIPADAVANSAPVSQDDHYTMMQGGSLLVPAPGILVNDFDPDGDTIIPGLSDVISAEVGTNWWTGGGFAYDPDPAFTGTFSFHYRAMDSHGLMGNWATISVDVLPAGVPVAVDDHYVAMSGAPVEVPAPGVLINDITATGALEVTFVDQPFHGTAEWTKEGGLRYTSTDGWTGVDSFVYGAWDGEHTTEATVTVTVIAPASDEPGDCDGPPTRVASPDFAAVAAAPAPGDPEPTCDEPGEPGDEPDDPTTTSTGDLPSGDGEPTPDPGSTPVVPAAAPREEPVALAHTGAEASAPLTVALAAVALGLLVRLAGRRRVQRAAERPGR